VGGGVHRHLDVRILFLEFVHHLLEDVLRYLIGHIRIDDQLIGAGGERGRGYDARDDKSQ
jgi:hypothetical protein